MRDQSSRALEQPRAISNAGATDADVRTFAARASGPSLRTATAQPPMTTQEEASMVTAETFVAPTGGRVHE